MHAMGVVKSSGFVKGALKWISVILVGSRRSDERVTRLDLVERRG
jgi:hypothetical protein